MSRPIAVVAAACVLLLTGCGAGTDASAPAPAAPTKPVRALGDPLEFKRSDNGQTVGTIKFLEAVAVPPTCLFTPPPAGGQVIAIRAEVVNPGNLFLPKPDVYGLSVIDQSGATQSVESVSVAGSCSAQFPEIGPSQSSGKTIGWAVLMVREANPTALVYAPYVAELTSTIGNIKTVVVTPQSAKVALPNPLP